MTKNSRDRPGGQVSGLVGELVVSVVSTFFRGVGPGFLKTSHQFPRIPRGENLGALGRVVEPAGFVLLDEPHGIHPAQGID
jgi:hypothetical protein